MDMQFPTELSLTLLLESPLLERNMKSTRSLIIRGSTPSNILFDGRPIPSSKLLGSQLNISETHPTLFESFTSTTFTNQRHLEVGLTGEENVMFVFTL